MAVEEREVRADGPLAGFGVEDGGVSGVIGVVVRVRAGEEDSSVWTQDGGADFAGWVIATGAGRIGDATNNVGG